MPCHDPTEDEMFQLQFPKQRAQLDRLTRLLCEATNLLDEARLPMTPGLANWHQEHKQADRERLTKEISQQAHAITRAKAEVTRAERELQSQQAKLKALQEEADKIK